MFNTINTAYPRPYAKQGNSTTNTGDATDKDGQNQQHQEQNQQQNHGNQVIARGRANSNVSSPAPTRAPIYSPAANAYANSGMYSRPIINNNAMSNMQYAQMAAPQYQPIQNNYQKISPAPQQISQAPARPAQQRSNKVNIAQILKDFRNTMKAIATPSDVEENVNNYLRIVEEQVHRPQPQVNIIQSNLKIAASLLDKYISETLNKESKVVQNWLDALFLQRINYNYNEEEINTSFLVKFPEENKNNNIENEKEEEKEETTTEPEPQLDNEVQTDEEVSAPVNIEPDTQINEEILSNNDEDAFQMEIEEYIPPTLEEEYSLAQEKISQKPTITIVPQDTRLKSLFIEAKKQAFTNNPQKAMTIFKEAFARAEKLKDTETQSRICLEIGKIYDDNDFVAQALTSYNKSLEYTTDVNVKSKAHYSMAQIYDDVNEIKPALEHYFTSISYAGTSNDIVGQSDSLTRVANIFKEKYDENAFEYYDVARKLIEQTSDNSMKGYVLSNTADACVQFKKNDKALKYYAEAVKNYEQANNSEEIAQNYKSAAELMISFNSPNKAKSLLKKAMINAVKTENEDLISEINLLLNSIQ